MTASNVRTICFEGTDHGPIQVDRLAEGEDRLKFVCDQPFWIQIKNPNDAGCLTLVEGEESGDGLAKFASVDSDDKHVIEFNLIRNRSPHPIDYTVITKKGILDPRVDW